MDPRSGLAALVLAPCACACLAACWLTSSFNGLESPGDASLAPDAASDVSADVGLDGAFEAAVDSHDMSETTPGDAGCLVDAYVSSVMADHPLAYWRLDEDAGTTAHSSGSGMDDGTYQGGVTLGVPGILPNDTAAAFDGDSGMVDVGARLAFLNANPFSVEAWIKPTKIDGYRGVLSNESPSIASRFGYLIYLDENDAGISTGFERWDDGTSSPTVFENAVTVNAWAHVVGTYDGQTMLLYVNGSPVATASSALKIPESASFVIAALNSGQTPSFFAGTIDEVAVYDHAVSAQCIQAHYELGTGNPP